MNKTEAAAEYFSKGYNCSQSVSTIFAEKFGIDKKQLAGIASVFGAGIARTQGLCGAVSGALMVLGLRYFDPENVQESKALSYKKGQEFMDRFIKEKGSVNCKELLGTDLAEAAQKDLYKTICADLVIKSVKILEEMI